MAPRRSLACVLGTGALTGLVAGAAAGTIDAVWSWAPAAQFLPHWYSRLRFVAYTALSHALAGVAIGFALAAALLVLSRATRLGDLLRFAFADHAARRAKDPSEAVVGLSLVLAGAPIVAGVLFVAYRTLVPFLANRHEPRLVVIVAIGGALAALVIAVPLAFVVARPVEAVLAALVPRVRALSSVWAPFVALGVLVAIALGVWAWREWDTAKLLPLRGPLVAVVGVLLAIATWRPAALLYERIDDIQLPRRVARYEVWIRRAVWAAAIVAVLVLVLATGGSAAVIKAESAYTGLGGPIARTLRKAFDRDGDGYSRYLGGGDCDDSDPLVHPGAPEIPDDDIDQNCVGGDAKLKRSAADFAFQQPPPSVPKDFNILLITIDTVRADHVGKKTYQADNDTAPNIDKLADEAVVFDNGWAHAPSTRYSMPAILTGRLPLDVHCDTPRCTMVTNVWPGLTMTATTIAEYLQPLGFVTGAITDIGYFERSRHMDQGFADYDTENARLHVDQNGPERSRGSSSKEESDKAIAFVDHHASDRFFLWVHYYDPHANYEPHADVTPFTRCEHAVHDSCDDMKLYDGEIRFTDLHLGRLFDELKAKGLYDKTVIVITGDHGEGFGEHHVKMHGYELYAAQTKVPLIIRVPGLPYRHAKTPAGHDDIIPTLVDLAGGHPDPDMMGRSLVDVLAGADPDRVVFQQLSSERGEKRGGADKHCHVIYNLSPDTSWEVYRVETDPLEEHDVASDDDACRDTRDAVAHWYDIEAVPVGAADALVTTLPPISKPAFCQLGESVHLLGVDAPARAKPGDTIQLVWTFQATGRVAPGWVVVTHVDGPNGQTMHADHPPTRPFEWWQAGQLIRDTTTVTLPRMPGRYTVKTGLWNNDQKRNIRAACMTAKVDKDNLVTATTIEVAPP